MQSYNRRQVLAGIGVSISISNAERVAAIDPREGVEKKWKARAETQAVSPPALNDGLYFGVDSKLISRDTDKGKNWERDLAGGYIEEAPTVSDGVVFTSAFDKVSAVSESTGEELWEFETGWGGNSTPTVDGNRVYVTRGNDKKTGNPGKTFCLDRDTGDLLWDVELGGDSYSRPAVGTHVYVGDTSGTLYALDPSTGATEWQFATDGPVTTSPVVANSKVCVTTGTGTLHVVGENGEEVWKQAVKSPIAKSKAVVKDTGLYVGDEEGVHAFDLTTGVKRWTFTTEGTAVPPIVDESGVYYASREGVTGALDASTGEPIWNVTFPESNRADMMFDSFSSKPVVGETELYVMTDGGILYKLG